MKKIIIFTIIFNIISQLFLLSFFIQSDLSILNNTFSEIVYVSNLYKYIFTLVFVVNGIIEIYILRSLSKRVKLNKLNSFLFILPGIFTLSVGIFNLEDFFLLHYISAFGFIIFWNNLNYIVYTKFSIKSVMLYLLTFLQNILPMLFIIFLGNNVITEIGFILPATIWVSIFLYKMSKREVKTL